MILKKVLVLGVSVAALTLSACTTIPKVEGYSVTLTVEELQQQQRISRAMDVPLGYTFSVVLAETTSTGFHSVIISDPSKVMQIGHNTLDAQEDWIFEAVGKGKTIVRLEYGESLESGEKGPWIFELHVTIIV